MDQWSGIPLAFFAAGSVDYESRDPQACADFVASILDGRQRAVTRVILYPDATHGRDHGRISMSFARTACKRAGCSNTNASNPEVAQRAKSDLLKYLQEKLPF